LVQGVILSANLIFTKEDNRQAKYFLAALIMLIVTELFRSLWFIFQTPDYEIVHFLFLRLIFTFPPNLFLYIRSMTQSEKLSRREIVNTHFFNLMVFVVTTIILMIQYNLTAWKITQNYGNLLKILMLGSFWVYYRKSKAEFDFFNAHKSSVCGSGGWRSRIGDMI
jgi:hypothetical protein